MPLIRRVTVCFPQTDAAKRRFLRQHSLHLVAINKHIVNHFRLLLPSISCWKSYKWFFINNTSTEKKKKNSEEKVCNMTNKLLMKDIWKFLNRRINKLKVKGWINYCVELSNTLFPSLQKKVPHYHNFSGIVHLSYHRLFFIPPTSLQCKTACFTYHHLFIFSGFKLLISYNGLHLTHASSFNTFFFTLFLWCSQCFRSTDWMIHMGGLTTWRMQGTLIVASP